MKNLQLTFAVNILMSFPRQKSFELKSIRIAIFACSWIGRHVSSAPSNTLVQHYPTCLSIAFEQDGPLERSLIQFSFLIDPLAWYKIY